jgi:hypothetical protein
LLFAFTSHRYGTTKLSPPSEISIRITLDVPIPQHTMSDYLTLTSNLPNVHPLTDILSTYRTALQFLLHQAFNSYGLLTTPNDAQIEYLALILAIKIHEDGPQRGFEMSTANLRMAEIPAAPPGVGVKIGLEYAGKEDEWWVAVGGMKVGHANAVKSFRLAVEEIGTELLRRGERR